MEALTQNLLNNFQRDFPLTTRPFTRIARKLDTDTQTVIERLRDLREKGVVSRVGAVFRPNTVGVSTLAAMSVPAEKLERTARIVCSFWQVNHNYEREHEYNLWFVVTSPGREQLESSLESIEKRTGYPVLSLPLLRDYHIDLGFPMRLDSLDKPQASMSPGVIEGDGYESELNQACAEDLIEAIQDGLPLVSRPYAVIAARLDWTEQRVLDALARMLRERVIRRLGVVVRHHELGYRANAMVVWDVPQGDIDAVGLRMGGEAHVTLCYQRPRHRPRWPYNLFCMVHGKSRSEVLHAIDAMTEKHGLQHLPRDILFSGRRFKQRGACYRRRH